LLRVQRLVSGVCARLRTLGHVRREVAVVELLVLLSRPRRLLPVRADLQQDVDAGRSADRAGCFGRAARRRRRTTMNAGVRIPVLGCALIFAGCVMMPTAPMVAVYPGSAKGLDQFRADDGYCRSVAQAAVAGPSQAATNNAAGARAGARRHRVRR